jgi:tRNA (adenine22-N1)-methyltransferase
MLNRLDTIVSLVDTCDTVADIGTDHGFVPVKLIAEGRCDRVIATDLNRGPYEIASKFVEEKGLLNQIEVRLGNGLDPVNLKEVDTIIVAGMGGLLIKKIIEDGLKDISYHHTLILQPMNASDKLRKFLFNKNFRIVEESLSKEDTHFYEIIKAIKTEERVNVEDDVFYEIGRPLIEKKHPLIRLFLKNKIRICQGIINEMIIGGKPKESVKSLEDKILSYRRLMEKHDIE